MNIKYLIDNNLGIMTSLSLETASNTWRLKLSLMDRFTNGVIYDYLAFKRFNDVYPEPVHLNGWVDTETAQLILWARGGDPCHKIPGVSSGDLIPEIAPVAVEIPSVIPESIPEPIIAKSRPVKKQPIAKLPQKEEPAIIVPEVILETIPETPIVKTPFDLSNREHLNLVLQAALEVWGPEEVWRVEDGKVRLFKSTARGLKGKEVPTPEEVRAIFSNYKAE